MVPGVGGEPRGAQPTLALALSELSGRAARFSRWQGLVLCRLRPWGPGQHGADAPVGDAVARGPPAGVCVPASAGPAQGAALGLGRCMFFCSSDFGRGLSGPRGAAPLSRVSMRPRGFPVGQEPRGICPGQPDGGWKQLVISHKTMLVPYPAGWRWKIKNKTKQNGLFSMHCEAEVCTRVF